MIVLDASAVLELVLGTAPGRAIAGRIEHPRETLHAPHLLDVEVAQVLRRYLREERVEPYRARLALEGLRSLDVQRYAHEPFLTRIWALRHNLTAYHAAYVALAEALGAPLLTADERLGSAPGHRAVVEVV